MTSADPAALLLGRSLQLCYEAATCSVVDGTDGAHWSGLQLPAEFRYELEKRVGHLHQAGLLQATDKFTAEERKIAIVDRLKEVVQGLRVKLRGELAEVHRIAQKQIDPRVFVAPGVITTIVQNAGPLTYLVAVADASALETILHATDDHDPCDFASAF